MIEGGDILEIWGGLKGLGVRVFVRVSFLVSFVGGGSQFPGFCLGPME